MEEEKNAGDAKAFGSSPNQREADLERLEQGEKFGENRSSDLNLSETDEDESEGLGDGKLGKSSSDLFSK